MVIFVPMSNLYINSVAISLVGRCLIKKERNEIAQQMQSHMRLRPWWNSYLGVNCGVGCGLLFLVVLDYSIESSVLPFPVSTFLGL